MMTAALLAGLANLLVVLMELWNNSVSIRWRKSAGSRYDRQLFHSRPLNPGDAPFSLDQVET